MTKKIYVISDASGETAEKMVRAALSQFDGLQYNLIRHHRIRRESELQRVFSAIDDGSIVATTFVHDDLRALAASLGESHGITVIDLIGPLLDSFASHLDLETRSIPGIQHRMDSKYRRRIEAIEYSVKHDDGLGLSSLVQAEIVITGVSRTGKTPLSIYLANRGHKVANVPLVTGLPVPQELLDMDRRKIVGLFISAEKLMAIREARLKKMGSRIRTSYTDVSEVRREIGWVRGVFQQHRWRSLDVTGKAVEEIAAEIEELVGVTDGG